MPAQLSPSHRALTLMAAFWLTLAGALVLLAPAQAWGCAPEAAASQSAEGAERSDDTELTDDEHHSAQDDCCPGELAHGECAADCDYCGCCGHMVGDVGWTLALSRCPAAIELMVTTSQTSEGHGTRHFKPPQALATYA
ncbi:hypothetical protein DL240_13895 [Lujinxingia litoralis]|uniref:DUF2946 domain-containing protein n=1 Tax=Lujinxingia litoralis TaxID=2211119 RepID=A0A328C540_9DELT|nr:hypothetical protein [Lujinxingia litoralis]RAL21220.1 hypothetical protein DL240_13895 [Lujinxingia litoralis]